MFEKPLAMSDEVRQDSHIKSDADSEAREATMSAATTFEIFSAVIDGQPSVSIYKRTEDGCDLYRFVETDVELSQLEALRLVAADGDQWELVDLMEEGASIELTTELWRSTTAKPAFL
jgi:hypothetical protein